MAGSAATSPQSVRLAIGRPARLRERLRNWVVMRLSIAQSGNGFFLDSAEIDLSGVIRLVGWCTGPFNSEPDRLPVLRLDGNVVPFLQHFRVPRTDVAPKPGLLTRQSGLVLDYLVPEDAPHRAKLFEVDLPGNGVLKFNVDLSFVNPHYRPLLNTTEVLHREHIYGSGPPNIAVHPDVLEIAKGLDGPVLDFGCGRGALVWELRRAGVEAYGLELESPIIRSCMPPGSDGIITLYDGTFPAPYRDRQFRSLICSEVLEHIPDYQGALAEIARIVDKKAVFTVPDASAIPVGYRHGAVPWHLLEGTHVNFFNQQSLYHALRPHFSHIEFGRIGPTNFADSSYYVSLSAFCVK